MIKIERTRIPTPLTIRDRRTLYSRMTAFFSVPPELRRQQKFDFDDRAFPKGRVMHALRALFYNKCAYCESDTSGESGLIHRHRPQCDTVTDKRQYLPDHYWWLAYRWGNLYLICRGCATAKGSYFPVEGKRAPINGKAHDLLAERPLLVDPCLDDPTEHFAYDHEGNIQALTKRGHHTIDLLNLNRSELVKERKNHIAKLNNDKTLHWLDMFTSGPFVIEDSRKYAGMCRFLQSEATLSSNLYTAEEKVQYDKYVPSITSIRQVTPEFNSPYCKKIEILNVGPIHEVTLELTGDASGQAPWLAIIGENNVGKSSVLKAIALTLASHSTRNFLKLKPSMISGRPNGGITIERPNNDKISIGWDGKHSFYSSEAMGANQLILAYGSTRLTSRAKFSNTDFSTNEKIGNLFDPFACLSDPERWLLSLDDEKFDYAARTLKTVLHLPQNAVFQRDIGKRKVQLKSYDEITHLSVLSDGLQSVIALVCDIMASAFSIWAAPEIAEGVVLIDEIENHLHPKWKMRITRMLRNAFPRIQFIVTTHDPLCLKGLYDGEVMVLRRNSTGQVRSVPNLPPISKMRIEQILTSEHFGLSTTLDPEIEDLYEDYYKILKNDERSQEEEKALEEISSKLDDNRLLGNTRRERLMLEAIDKYLSHQPEAEPDAHEMAKELESKLFAILKRAGDIGE